MCVSPEQSVVKPLNRSITDLETVAGAGYVSKRFDISEPEDESQALFGINPLLDGSGRNNGNKNCDSGKSRIDYYPTNTGQWAKDRKGLY
jgi:hypothetical protein